MEARVCYRTVIHQLVVNDLYCYVDSGREATVLVPLLLLVQFLLQHLPKYVQVSKPRACDKLEESHLPTLYR